MTLTPALLGSTRIGSECIRFRAILTAPRRVYRRRISLKPRRLLAASGDCCLDNKAEMTQHILSDDAV